MIPSPIPSLRLLLCSGLALSSALLQTQAGTPVVSSGKEAKTPIVIEDNWKDRAIAPVLNPVYFESPFVQTEARAIFMHHQIDNDFLTEGGDVRVYALQLRWAITPRLAFIATKDGFIDFDSGNNALPDTEGFADIAAGFKYALVDSQAHDFILTPGFTFEFATGSDDSFQGNGSGEWNFFVSAAKGFGDFHVVANTGVRVPMDSDAENSSLHYSLQLDYYVCQWFIPYVAINGFTTLSNGEGLPLETEGVDLINFGSSNARDTSEVTAGLGFRSKLTKNLDLGVGYEKGITEPHGLFGDRFTVDLVVHF